MVSSDIGNLTRRFSAADLWRLTVSQHDGHEPQKSAGVPALGAFERDVIAMVAAAVRAVIQNRTAVLAR